MVGSVHNDSRLHQPTLKIRQETKRSTAQCRIGTKVPKYTVCNSLGLLEPVYKLMALSQVNFIMAQYDQKSKLPQFLASIPYQFFFLCIHVLSADTMSQTLPP